MVKALPFSTEPGDITVQVGDAVLIHRCGYLVVRDNKLLTLYVPKDDYYFIPGGRVSCGSCSLSTVVREVQEEMGMDIEAKDAELAAVIECFFTHQRLGVQCHEIAMYYRVQLPEGTAVPPYELDGACLPFRWLPIDRLADYNLKPVFMPMHTDILLSGFRHIIHYEEGFEVDHG